MNIVKTTYPVRRLVLGLLALLLLVSCATPAPNALPPMPAPVSTSTGPAAATTSQTLPPTQTVTLEPTSVAPTDPPTPSSTPPATLTALPAAPNSFENTPVPQAREVLSPANAAQAVPVARWGKGSIQDVAYSADGKLLGVASSLGIYLYNSLALDPLAFYPTDASITAIQFSPDGQTFASGYADGRVDIRAVSSGSVRQTIQQDKNRVIRLAYAPDGAQLAMVQDNLEENDRGGTLYMWDLAAARLVSQQKIPYQESFDLTGQSIAYMDGYGEQSSISIRDVVSAKTQYQVPYRGYFYALALSPDGKNLVYEAAEIVLWHADRPAEPTALTGIPDYFTRFYAYSCQREADGPGLGKMSAAAFSPDGRLLAIGARQGVVQLRSAEDGKLLSSFPGWAERILFAPDSQTFVVLPGDGSLEVHRSKDGLLVKQLTGHTNGFTSVAFSPDGRYLAAGAKDNLLRVWRVRDGQRAMNLEVQANRVAFSPDGSLLAAGSDRGGLVVWNLGEGTPLQVVPDYQTVDDIYRINALTFSTDGRSLLSGTQACTFTAWDPHSGKQQCSKVNGTQPGDYARNTPVNSLPTSPENRLVAVNNEQSVLLFNLQTHEALEPLQVKDSTSANRVAFLPKSDRVVIGGWGDFQVWDLHPYRLVYWMEGPSLNLVVSPDGQMIATSDPYGTIYLWRAADGQRLAELRGHRDEITQLAFSTDGRYLASAGRDGTLYLWAVQ